MMDINLILTLVGFAIAVIGGVGSLIINLSSKISKLEGRLDTLASDNRLREQVDKIQDGSIQKLQQLATDLHHSTQAQFDRLAADIAQQQAQVHTSLQVLKTQEASSLTGMDKRAQQLVQQLQEIEQHVQQLRLASEAEYHCLTAEIAQQREQVHAKGESLTQQETTLLEKMADTLQQMKQVQQVKQEIEQAMEVLQQERVSIRLATLEMRVEKLQNMILSPEKLWWYQLDSQWKTLFKDAIGIKNEGTENELRKIFNLMKSDGSEKKASTLESLRALTGLQTSDYSQWKTILKEAIGIKSEEPTENELLKIFSLTKLDCSKKKLTSLDPLRALTGLQTLDCSENQLTHLEPLHGLKNLQELRIIGNSSLSQEEIEDFKKAVPSCSIIPYRLEF